MIDDKTLMKLKEQAGISQESYALKQLITEGEVLEDKNYPPVENMLGPYKMPSGNIKYFNKYTNQVVEADKMFPNNEEPDVIKRTLDNVDDADDADDRMGKTDMQEHEMEYPKEVKDSVKKRIKELEKALDEYSDKGYNDNPGAMPNAVEALHKIDEHLSEKTMESFKEAQIFYQTLMSPIINLFPTTLIVWLSGDYDKLMKPAKKQKDNNNSD